MRQIKFRAFSVKDKCMLDWSTIKQTAFNYGEVHLMHSVLTSNEEIYHVMQFTGLTDKNGNEIYEGDILGTGHLEFKCKVTFEDGCFQLKTNQEQGNSHLSQGRASRLDIIGNIHEHAHLLNN